MSILDAIDTVTLRDPVADVSATFAPGAGMVCCSLRHEGEELLAQNDGLEAYARTGATMGIPLLHPWANRLDGWSYTALGVRVDLEAARAIVPVEEHGLPIHGTLPRAWRVVASDRRLAAELAAGESAVGCRIVTDERLIPAGPAERVDPYSGPLGDRAYDDGFDGVGEWSVYADAGGGRRIEVAFEQATATRRSTRRRPPTSSASSR